jgi:hypothetical protein
MRLLTLAITLPLAALTTASAQRRCPIGRMAASSSILWPTACCGLDTRTGQVSECGRSDAGWACKLVPDERSALETEVARLQDENTRLKIWIEDHRSPMGRARPPQSPATRRSSFRCRARQGDFLSRTGLAPSDRDGEDRAEGRREEELRDLSARCVRRNNSEILTHITI